MLPIQPEVKEEVIVQKPETAPQPEQPKQEIVPNIEEKLPEPEAEIAHEPTIIPEVPEQKNPTPESQPKNPVFTDIATSDIQKPELENNSTDVETVLAMVDPNETTDLTDDNNSGKIKKKRKPLFPRLKERFSKSNLSNALLPEAYSSGSDD